MALATSAEKDGFFYAGDALYREASNLNRHRRATLPELKAHFNGKDDENRAAHWYEAQLLHYGLPPSKVKGTAHKRLFDAVMKGGLVVPAHVQRIEADLKKEWAKREREAKKMLKAPAAAAPPKGTKRKADQVSASTNVSVNVSVQVSSTGKVSVQAAQPASKKTKTTFSRENTKATSAAKSTAASNNKKTAVAQTARKTIASQAKTVIPKTPKPATAKSTTKPKATPKQTISGFGTAPASGMGTSGYAMSGSSLHNDEAPPPYSELDNRPQAKIGLLNGRYQVSSDYIDANFSEWADDLGLIATLDSNNLWLKFNFGIVEGIVSIGRPDEVDTECATGMEWRGRALDGEGRFLYSVDTTRRFGPGNNLYFMGGGHIRGNLRYGSPGAIVQLGFDAFRLDGQSWTSEVSPTQARNEWASAGRVYG